MHNLCMPCQLPLNKFPNKPFLTTHVYARVFLHRRLMLKTDFVINYEPEKKIVLGDLFVHMQIFFLINFSN